MSPNVIPKLLLTLLFVFFSLLGTVPVGAALITIDDFATGDPIAISIPPDTNPTTVTAQGTQILNGVLGLDYRTVSVDRTVGGSTNVAQNRVSANVNPDDGLLSFSSGVAASGNFSVLYDANGAGLGGFDLTDGGTNEMVGIDVFFADKTSPWTLTIVDMNDISDSETILVAAGTSPLTIYFELSNFSSDVSDVKSIKLDITGSLGGNYQLTQIFAATVPEPSSLAILAGLVGLAFVGIRYSGCRKSSQKA